MDLSPSRPPERPKRRPRKNRQGQASSAGAMTQCMSLHLSSRKMSGHAHVKVNDVLVYLEPNMTHGSLGLYWLVCHCCSIGVYQCSIPG